MSRQEELREREGEEEYADLLALCQFLLGPSSSQMGIALGITRAGLWGGLAAWLGFTLPSALALTLFAYVAATFKGVAQSGWRFLRGIQAKAPTQLPRILPRRRAVACWIIFLCLLIGLPVLRQLTQNQPIALFDTFFRVGSLVFGGGHVVLPLLQREVVPAGWVTHDQFITGYAAAQGVPSNSVNMPIREECAFQI